MISSIIGGLGGLVGTIYSFTQADKEAQKIQDATMAANKALMSAKARAYENPFLKTTINQDLYDEMSRKNTQNIANIVEKATEAQDTRTMFSLPGVVQAKMDTEETIRGKKAKDLDALNLMKAQSEDAVNDRLLQMDLDIYGLNAAGARRAEQLRNKRIEQGFEGIGTTIEGFGEAAPLYPDLFNRDRSTDDEGTAYLKGMSVKRAEREEKKRQRKRRRGVEDLGYTDYSISDPSTFQTTDSIFEEDSIFG